MSSQMPTRNIKIPITVHSKLKATAAIADRKLQEVVEEALTEYLERTEQQDPETVIEIKR